MKMVLLDTSHSEMFPYAITLAIRFGAKQIFIEPHINDHTPDVLGITAGNSYIIVECDVHQPTCRRKISKLYEDKELMEKSTVLFILRDDVNAPAIKNLIEANFGKNAFYEFDELTAQEKINLVDLLR